MGRRNEGISERATLLIRPPQELRDRIEKVAEESERSMSWVASRLVEWALDQLDDGLPAKRELGRPSKTASVANRLEDFYLT